MGRRGVRRDADGGVGKPRRKDRHHGAEQHKSAGQQKQQRCAVAECGARGPPDHALKVGRIGRRGVGCQNRESRQRAIGQDGGDLQRDHEAGADDRGEYLCDQPGTARADQAEQRDRHGDGNRRGGQADGDDDAVGREPSDTAADHENIDERRRQHQRHRRDGQRDRRDPNRKYIGQRHRRGHDQIEIGAGVKHPRHRFDRLRQHQGPCQQYRRGDDDEGGFVERRREVREPADHGIGRQVHDRGKNNQANDRTALSQAPAGRHHRQPFAPGQPDFVPGEPAERRG